jgi:hypothetical protein
MIAPAEKVVIEAWPVKVGAGGEIEDAVAVLEAPPVGYWEAPLEIGVLLVAEALDEVPDEVG